MENRGFRFEVGRGERSGQKGDEKIGGKAMEVGLGMGEDPKLSQWTKLQVF